jgi:type IV pilus assembly protein PilX
VNNFPPRQRGVALVVSLVLLLLLTILAITAARTSSLQQRMAGNAQEQNSAFQAAESGLSRWIALFTDGQAIPATETNGDGSVFRLDNPPVEIQANCLFGSVGTSGFVFDCYHVTSTATSADGSARARHQIGYLTRTGQ